VSNRRGGQRRPQGDGQWRPDAPPQQRLDAPRVDETGRRDETLSPIEAEVRTERDDHVTATLTTRHGSEKFQVPPIRLWGSVARNAMFTRGDDLLWAQRTLPLSDVERWARLDPTAEDAGLFLEEIMRSTGQNPGE
jgi:hypothetical protein